MVVARKTLVMNKFIVTNRCYIVDLVAKGSVAIFIYPVSALGGFQYISALKKAFPHISMDEPLHLLKHVHIQSWRA
ncbi:hypothetical protein JHK86_022371 [Glycine max]|nr:hypothetical protein JHK86_022371 [Glycine max]